MSFCFPPSFHGASKERNAVIHSIYYIQCHLLYAAVRAEDWGHVIRDN